MRNSIGGAWLFSISITLMMFIIAYVTITIDYSNAYQLKNDVALYLEQYQGFNEKSAKKITSRIRAIKYNTYTDCTKNYSAENYFNAGSYNGAPSSAYVGMTKQNQTGRNNFVEGTNSNPVKKAFVCIYKYQVVTGANGHQRQNKYFYSVSTSFGFTFPIIGDIFHYRVSGETNALNYTYDGYNTNFTSQDSRWDFKA